MKIYPEKYDKLEVTPAERRLMRRFDQALPSNSLAYFLLRVNPRKRAMKGNKAELWNMLIMTEGILFMRHMTQAEPQHVRTIIGAYSNPVIFNSWDKDIRTQLERSQYLVDPDTKKLRFAINMLVIFSEVSSSAVLAELPTEQQAFCHRHVLFKDDIDEIRVKGKDKLLEYLAPAEFIQEEDINSIFQRLCPENTIPRKVVTVDKEDAKVQLASGKLQAEDRAVMSYRLDDWQINTINRIGRGNQLILACAGSGKSVLLISKCFKLAALNPTEKFLLTCYNANLRDYYQWVIDQAGFREKNVTCNSFYSLCSKLLKDNGRPLPPKGDGYFEALFNEAREVLAKGDIKERYSGIFIDEIQVFDPKWYQFCFDLLKDKADDNHFFTIAGDKSQDIKNNIKRGKAPWQGHGEPYPEYRGRTMHIKRNYRNSKPINDAIDRYIECAQRVGSKIGVDFAEDPELFLRGEAYKPGNAPVLVELQKYTNDAEVEAICDAVQRLLQSGYSTVDIGIVFYNTRNACVSSAWRSSSYNLLEPLEKEFSRRGWSEPVVLMSNRRNNDGYGARTGVTIATIQGALGLDFRAIILAGLMPLGEREKASCLADFSKATGKDLEDKQDAFRQNVNYLYTGCSRAKDELTIILSAPKGESMYMDLLRESMK